MGTYTCHSVHLGVWEECLGDGALLYHESVGMSTGHQSRWQTSLPAKSSCHPWTIIYTHLCLAIFFQLNHLSNCGVKSTHQNVILLALHQVPPHLSLIHLFPCCGPFSPKLMLSSVPTVCYKYGGILTWWQCLEGSLFEDSQVKVIRWRPGSQYWWLSNKEREEMTHMWTSCSTRHCTTRGDSLTLGLQSYEWQETRLFALYSPSLCIYREPTETQRPSLSSPQLH